MKFLKRLIGVVLVVVIVVLALLNLKSCKEEKHTSVDVTIPNSEKKVSKGEPFQLKNEPRAITPTYVDTSAQTLEHLDNEIGYTVNVVKTEWQTPEKVGLSYPWLTVEPDKTYALQATVSNGNVENNFTLTVSNAMTNVNLVNVTYPEGSSNEAYVKSDSPIDFEKSIDIMGGGHYVSFEVPARKTAVLNLTLKVPKGEFDGTAVGGFLFRRVMREEEKQKEGYSQQYLYSKAFVLQEKSNVVKADLRADDVTLSVTNQKPVGYVELTNPTGQILHEVETHVKLLNEVGDLLSEDKKENGTIVSYNTFKLSVPLKEALAPGKYRIETSVKSREGKWSFKQVYTVNREAVNELKANSNLDAEIKRKDNSNDWHYIILAVGLVLIVVIMILHRRNAKQAQVIEELRKREGEKQ
jgi:hypothetical protein